MLFVCKVPMVYGTITSGIIVFGAVVFVSTMLSGSGPSPSSMASAAALYVPSPPPRFTDEEKRQFPRLNSCRTLS